MSAWAKLVPELLVADLPRSLHFWCDLLGFAVRYDRAADGFAYLDQGGAQLMLEERRLTSRQWVSATLEAPYGRGVNLQFEVAEIALVSARLSDARWPLVMDCEERWYRAGPIDVGVRQLVVADPDGYLARPSQDLGQRPR
jgi:catechol 2,3-dioxygenase-like lactoylglutathione lyase family enzyme